MMLSGDPDGLFNLANDLQEAKKSALIEAAYELAIENRVQEAFLNYGNYLSDRSQKVAARAMWERAFKAGDERAAVLIAQQLAEDGDLNSAEIWYAKATNIHESALLHSRLKTNLGKHEEALAILQENSESNAEAAVELALHHRGLFPDGGIELLERHHAKGHLEVDIPLASLYERSGRIEEAIALLEESARTGEPNAPLNLGILLQQSGREAEGIRWIKRAAKAGDKEAKRALKSF